MSQDQSNTTRSRPISFPNGRHALLLETSPNTTAKEIRTQLKLNEHKAVILILGDVDIPDYDSRDRLFQLFSRGLAHAVAENDVLIIDGGTESEVMTGLGKALLGRVKNVQLLGVANESELNIPGTREEQVSNAQSAGIANGRKMLESYHTHFVAVKSPSSDTQIDQMDALAEELSQGPILTVLVNGSPLAKDEVERSVRQGWPVLVITGSGGFADAIQQAWQAKQDYMMALSKWNQSSSKESKPAPPFVPDPVLSEVIVDGDLLFFSITDTPENLERRIDLRLKTRGILQEVYEQRREYASDARQHQKTFHLQQNWILFLGVLITALAAFQTFYKQTHVQLALSVGNLNVTLESVLYIALLGLPIVLSVLITGANRFNPGNQYITRRAAAEAFSREMFRYRTRTGIYSDSIVIQNWTTREATLSRMTEAITRQWVEGNLDFTIFPGQAPSTRSQQSQTWSKRTEESLSDYLPPNRYITDRLDNQLDYYKKSSLKLGRQLLRLEWLILGLGGLGTFLTSLNAEVFTTVSTACATALVSYLAYRQVANNLKQYNYIILSLNNIKNWWEALGENQADLSNVERLVEHVETTLQSEQAGWVQQMQSALTLVITQHVQHGNDSTVTEPIKKSLEG